MAQLFTHYIRELGVDALEAVGGDMALNLAIKAYEDLGKRFVAAVHQPVTQPSSPLHF
jgi:hypothetical protein